MARALRGGEEEGQIRVLWGSTGAGDEALAALAAALSSPRAGNVCGGKGRWKGDGAFSSPAPPPRLVELDLSGCSRASAAGLRSLAFSGGGNGSGGSGSKSGSGVLGALRSLHASNSLLFHPYPPLPSPSPSSPAAAVRCPGCGDRCGGGCAGSPFQLLARSAGPSLRSLTADGAPLPDAAAASLGLLCRRLRSLSLVACPSLSGAGIASLAKGCPRLTELALGGGGGGGASWSERDLLPIAPRLRSLRLARRPALRDAELRALLYQASQLRKFVLSAAPRVTDEGLTPDFEGEGEEEGGEAAETEEAATTAKAKAKTKTKSRRPFLPNLDSLSIPCCTGIQGLRLPSLTRLTSLELLGCSGIAPEAAARAAVSLPRLREIVLPPGASMGDIPVGAPGSRLEALAVFH